MEVVSRVTEAIRMNSQDLKYMNQESSQNKNEKRQSSSLYRCNKCKDTGWILIEQKKMQPLAVSCECRELDKIKNHWKAAGINPDISKQTFKNFEVWNESSKKAKDIAIAFYKDFSDIRTSRKNSILCCGQVGAGKTHLSVALALNFLNNKVKVVYMPYRDVITSLKQNMLDEEYYKKELSKYKLCDVLLIDDLFKGKITEADINLMFEIINYRYLNYLPIIVSTEYKVEEMLSFDEAIGSRIYEMCKDYIVEIDKNKNNNYRLR